MRQGNNNNRRQRGRNNRRNNNQPNRNQVYDSNGPGVRVRGTAQQVMEKLGEDYYSCDLKRFQEVIETIQKEYELEGKTWSYHKNVH